MFKFSWTKQHTTALVYTCVVALASILLLFLLITPGGWLRFLQRLLRAMSPLFFGFALAYLLDAPCAAIERLLSKGNAKKARPKLLRALSIALTFPIVTAVLVLFVGMIVPQIRTSYRDLEAKAGIYLDEVTRFASSFLTEHIRPESGIAFSREEILTFVSNAIDKSFDYFSEVAKSVVTLSSRMITLVADIFVSLLFSVFFLYDKERILARISSLSATFLPSRVYGGTKKWLRITDEIFGGFLVGKAVDSLLIAVINFVVFGLFGIPYYPLIALINGVTNMIPYFGPFIGAVPSTVLILIADPGKAVWFVVLTVVIQQIDGNLIGPHILGDKLGIDSLCIVLAITIFSELFGLFGLFLGVPIFAVLYRIVKEAAEARLLQKGRPAKTEAYLHEEVGK